MLVGFYYNHVAEAGEDVANLIQGWQLKESERVELRILKDFDFDGRRFWRLASVWFDGEPVMLIQNAGREGDDHARRFVSSSDGFAKLIMHLRQEAARLKPEHDDVVVVDIDLDDAQSSHKLAEFYGNHLDGHFERYRY